MFLTTSIYKSVGKVGETKRGRRGNLEVSDCRKSGTLMRLWGGGGGKRSGNVSGV